MATISDSNIVRGRNITTSTNRPHHKERRDISTMMATTSRQDIEFLALDGVKLCGYLYPAGEKRPTIIMTPGMPESIDPFVTLIASKFQSNGYTALVYNNRNCYTSSGTPRNEYDPLLQQRDYTAALNFCLSLPSCDPKKIVFWGGSLSGANVISAAAIDSRAAGVISLVPSVSGEYITQALGPMTKFIFADSVSVCGGEESQLFPVGDTVNDVWGGCTGYTSYLAECERLGGKWDNEATTMSMFHLQSLDPGAVIHRVKGRVLMVVAEEDVVIPWDVQKEIYRRSTGKGNEIYEVKGKGHFDVYYGEGGEEVLGVMLGFLGRLNG